MRAWRLLAIPGSLRAASRNAALLRAARRLAPAGLVLECYADLGRLPLFNPDLESPPPAPVATLEAAVRAADGLLIACPEYAHGVPGALKNALDWLVGGEGFVNKPVALWNTSPRAQHAQAALAETVTTMSGRLVTEAALALPLLGTTLDDAAIAADPSWAAHIRAALQRYASALASLRRQQEGTS